MKLIVTGAGGLLAPALIADARRAGHRVLAIGRTPRPPEGLACDHWLTADLADPALRNAGLGPDWAGAAVCHLAADTRVYSASRDFLHANLATTVTACALARQTGGRLVFFSSAAVYSGPFTRRPVTGLREDDPTDPGGAYGRSKRAAEEHVALAGVDAVVLRLFGVLSERLATVPDRGNLVQAILRALTTGEPVSLATDVAGHPLVRDYVTAADVSTCALAALGWRQTAPGPLVLNVCSGVPTTPAQVHQAAERAFGRPIPWRPEVAPDTVNPVMLGDPGRLKALLGRVPVGSLDDFWAGLRAGQAPAAGASAGARGSPLPP